MPQTFFRWIYNTSIYLYLDASMNVYLSRNAVTDKQTSSLVVEIFDWRHVMATAVKRNGLMRRLVTNFRRLGVTYFARDPLRFYFDERKMKFIS